MRQAANENSGDIFHQCSLQDLYILLERKFEEKKGDKSKSTRKDRYSELNLKDVSTKQVLDEVNTRLDSDEGKIYEYVTALKKYLSNLTTHFHDSFDVADRAEVKALNSKIEEKLKGALFDPMTESIIKAGVRTSVLDILDRF